MTGWTEKRLTPIRREPLGAWFLLQQAVEGRFRVFRDDQTVFAGSGFALLSLRLAWSLGHVDTNYALSCGKKEVPRPGVGPGRLVKSPACKAGLSTNSSTGAHERASALDVGTGGGSNLKPVPASLGPSSAALDLTSRLLLLPTASRTVRSTTIIASNRSQFAFGECRGVLNVGVRQAWNRQPFGASWRRVVRK